MPRPPLPKIVTHPLELRARSLRILLEIVREKYPQYWAELVDAVRACGGDIEAVNARINGWLRKRGLMDEPEQVAGVVAWRMLVRQAELPELRQGKPALLFLSFAVRDYLPKKCAPQPVILEAQYLLGENMAWAFGLQFDEMRAHILADFSEKLDAALAEYRRNCEAAGLVEQPVSPEERKRLELLAEYIIEGKTVAELADARQHSSDARIRANLRAAAEACGLPLRTRGRPVQRKTTQRTEFTS